MISYEVMVAAVEGDPVAAEKVLEHFDRYIDQLEDFAAYLRGEKQNPYTLEHEHLVQKTVLAVSGYTKWENHSAAAGCSETETVFPQKSKCKI